MYFKTVESGGTGRIIEKKSKFIADVFYVASEEEAAVGIETAGKKYHDARHHCWAYIIIKEGRDIERMSDDGEPAGTAGRPILDAIRGAGLKNVLIVVTRYFGGTLLGTGGLVRAYSTAACEGLSHSRIITAVRGRKLRITTDYAVLEKLRHILNRGEIPVLDAKYGGMAVLTVFVPKTEEQAVIKNIAAGTAGRATIDFTEGETLRFIKN